jgi:hypothetical protein
MFALLWFLYFSLYQVGQTFLGFQWDILLLEAGGCAIIASPLYAWKTKEGKVETSDGPGGSREHGSQRLLCPFGDQKNKTSNHIAPRLPLLATGLMMFRWLFFRLMYLSGVVKLTR